MESSDNQVIISGDMNPYAYYSRYPDMGKTLWPKEAYDLECPKCHEQEIVLIEEADSDSKMMIGDLVQCWTCKNEFRVTQNCWKFRRIK